MSAPGITVDGDDTNQTLFGSRGDDSMSGMGGVDFIYSGMGDDFVFGGAGRDYINVDLGNDWYDGGDDPDEGFGDTVSFVYIDGAPGASQLNYRGVTFDLAKTVQDLGYLGRDTFYGFENVNGSFGHDVLYGDAGVNDLFGGEGNDALDGRAGRDALQGSVGADSLTGGASADTLAGFFNGVTTNTDGARDTYRYLSPSESIATIAARDTIWGFFNGGLAGGDKISLAAIDADPRAASAGNQAFKFIGAAAFTTGKVGEVQVRAENGVYMVRVDTDTDNNPEMSIVVNSAAPLVGADFFL